MPPSALVKSSLTANDWSFPLLPNFDYSGIQICICDRPLAPRAVPFFHNVAAKSGAPMIRDPLLLRAATPNVVDRARRAQTASLPLVLEVWKSLRRMRQLRQQSRELREHLAQPDYPITRLAAGPNP